MRPLQSRSTAPESPSAVRLESGLAVVGALTLAGALALAVWPDLGSTLADRLAAPGPPPGTEQARALRVVDGDTLVVAGERTVRVLGIDTPETSNPAMAGPQPLGDEATRRFAELVEGRVVGLEPDVTDRDHYGRLLRHVWVGRRLASEVLIRDGLGRVLVIPPDGRHADRLRAAESAARAAGRGVWGLPRPTPLAIFATPAR